MKKMFDNGHEMTDYEESVADAMREDEHFKEDEDNESNN